MWLDVLQGLGPALLAGLFAVVGARLAFRRELKHRAEADFRREQVEAARAVADGVYDYFRVEHDLMMRADDERISERWKGRSVKLLDLRRYLAHIPEPWRSKLSEVIDVLYDYDEVAQWTQALNAYVVLKRVHEWTDKLVAAFICEEPVPEVPEEIWIVRLGLEGVREQEVLQRSRPDVEQHLERLERAKAQAQELRERGDWPADHPNVR